jgi:hypothetical protein
LYLIPVLPLLEHSREQYLLVSFSGANSLKQQGHNACFLFARPQHLDEQYTALNLALSLGRL